ncbi:cobalt-precorrin-5B (C(1))-methyltransferase CbiD [uncultured Porphyromonas sp.]|uniref:cobalt-precorrin-5B (C(1))-methyltransferase CbiD n=1 Tax=uncultured Porphyromonas sp. TaxID=159274 RepID=UPI00259BDA03|nr:cobalt-precorrin-5B (C(1))-methyltransferase CbiD [uncultured Porphyromonas sp.]
MNLLILGGTTEGRRCVEVCEEAGVPFYYSTFGSSQEITLHNGIHITGGKDLEELQAFCQENNVGLIIDAAHPFATNLHSNVGALHLPVIRYERVFPAIPEEVQQVSSFEEAIALLHQAKPTKVLALTGVNSIAKLQSYWQEHETYFRVMPIAETEKTIERTGIPRSQIIYYDKELSDEELFRTLQPDLIIVKESGTTSGFTEKVSAALSLGISVIAITRPDLGYTPNLTVTGKIGLRRGIEQLLPEFFPQKIGFTTGTTATAATKAALIALIDDIELSMVEVTLPDGEIIPFPIQSVTVEGNEATAVAIKYSGDDPDVTNGAEICATVSLHKGERGVEFKQGIGVGRVTLPGLGLEIGGPAINKTPRRMITSLCEELLDLTQIGVEITIFVPEGESIAKNTFNPRLGIVDGISIIGTTGVVRPYSNDTWIASIRREMEVSKAVGVEHLVLNSGGRSEKYLKARFPHLPPNAFIQYGNFIGETLTFAHQLTFPTVTLGIMLGKAVKLAAGELDTHSHKVTMDKEFLKQVLTESREEVDISGITLAREIWQLIPNKASKFYQLIIQHCYEVCQPIVPHTSLEILLIDDTGQFISQKP